MSKRASFVRPPEGPHRSLHRSRSDVRINLEMFGHDAGGVAALPGHSIERVRFRTPVPLNQGFEQIERLITGVGRPLTSFCACELRSPGQFTEQGFREFNERYVVILEKWGLFEGQVNPVA